VEAGEARVGVKPIIDLSAMDLAARIHGKAEIERFIPHRGQMSLVDWIVWTTPDFRAGVGLKHVRTDEFWVPGHFPGKALMPGVLMIEAAAQFGCYLYNRRLSAVQLMAFVRIEEASFRLPVVPGDDLFLLATEVKYGRRRFVSNIQGVVDGRVTFDARIAGMQL
jgi:3-hydroxyacyl-[acyl-carrier-protein] dehydratase